MTTTPITPTRTGTRDWFWEAAYRAAQRTLGRAAQPGFPAAQRRRAMAAADRSGRLALCELDRPHHVSDRGDARLLEPEPEPLAKGRPQTRGRVVPPEERVSELGAAANLIALSLSGAGPATAQALHARLPIMFTTVEAALVLLRKQGRAWSAYLPGYPAVYALTDDIIGLEQIPGYSELVARNRAIVQERDQGLPPKTVGQQHGLSPVRVMEIFSDRGKLHVRWCRPPSESERRTSSGKQGQAAARQIQGALAATHALP